MKLKDITHWSERWSTPLGTMDAHAPVADGVLVALSLWGTSIIGLAVQCPRPSDIFPKFKTCFLSVTLTDAISVTIFRFLDYHVVHANHSGNLPSIP